MPLNPDNHVIKLCVAGMQAEQADHFDSARELFQQAWDARQNDLEACIAAHYMARLQTDPDRILEWNLTALHYADAVRAQIDGQTEDTISSDLEIESFYPSLYLNVGSAYETLGDTANARHYYQLAANQLTTQGLDIGTENRVRDDYRTTLQRGITAALQRMHKPI